MAVAMAVSAQKIKIEWFWMTNFPKTFDSRFYVHGAAYMHSSQKYAFKHMLCGYMAGDVCD